MKKVMDGTIAILITSGIYIALLIGFAGPRENTAHRIAIAIAIPNIAILLVWLVNSKDK